MSLSSGPVSSIELEPPQPPQNPNLVFPLFLFYLGTCNPRSQICIPTFPICTTSVPKKELHYHFPPACDLALTNNQTAFSSIVMQDPQIEGRQTLNFPVHKIFIEDHFQHCSYVAHSTDSSNKKLKHYSVCNPVDSPEKLTAVKVPGVSFLVNMQGLGAKLKQC